MKHGQYGREAERPKLGQAVISCPLVPSFFHILASSYPSETNQRFPGALLLAALLGGVLSSFIYLLFLDFWGDLLKSRE